MMFIHNIGSVAKYESIILIRSWFFKIFTVLAILFLGSFDAAIIFDNGTWVAKALPANIPYVNLLLLNVGQAIIAIFLSSEFLKRDKKLDTSEVFYVRPLSNAEYVIGKIWGNLRVFLILNVIVLAVALLFSLMGGLEIDWSAYLIYFLLISIPTLIFIIGLSTILMLVFKNQALTFIILLGYIGLTVFYITNKFYYLFDYMAYSLPLVRSTIVGFTNWDVVLNHRAIYLFAGLAFLCFTIVMFGRLPNSRRSGYPWLALGCVLLLVSVGCGYSHVNRFIAGNQDRRAFIDLNNQYVDAPKMIVDAYDIEVEQQANSFSSIAKMKGRALSASEVFTFCLNPALDIKRVESNGQELRFDRDRQILQVHFGREVAPGDTVSFQVAYSGRIDERFCYLDIEDKILEEQHTDFLLNFDKRYSFIESNFLLLTPEIYWYPRPGTSYSDKSSDWQQNYFSRFDLSVKPLNGLTALSQGTSSRSDGLYRFSADHPSPSLSLVIGDYQQIDIAVDSVLYSAFYIKGHDYFIAPFDSIRDTIPGLIRDIRENMERTYKLSYPFDRFSIVEVPAQFTSYTHAWSQAEEKVQPEMVLFPEKGYEFYQMNIEQRKKSQQNWARRRGQELSDNDAAIAVFNEIMNGIFLRSDGGYNFASAGRGNYEITARPNPYFQFPQLFNFRYNIFSPDWPIANRMIELYLLNRLGNEGWERSENGLSNNEKANLLMEDHSFKELLGDPENHVILNNIIGMRGYALFADAESKIGTLAFRDTIYAVLDRNTFSNIQFEHLLDTLGMISGADIVSNIIAWNHPTPLPFYVISQPEATRYDDRGKEDFVIKLQITNRSDIDGIIQLETQVGGRGQQTDPDPRMDRKMHITAHETKEVISVWTESPREVIINTLISKNLPYRVNLPIRSINQTPGGNPNKEGDYTIASATVVPDEVIIDNEDPLFSLTEHAVEGLLPQWLDRVEDNSFAYSGISWWRPPLRWTLTTNAGYYGEFVRSAYVIKSGDGSQLATWKVPIPSPGYYDLYYWAYNDQQQQRNQRGRADGEYHFKIYYDEEVEDAYINMRRSNQEWESLGAYFLNSDTIRVVLSNDSKLRTVTADAVRLVKRQ